eukprot:CAMPEP_0196768094 /NCGR_PEP_ID=MMETSP1095-20130614/42329_1 /TAXON_ID=96789 ORGANISM="Chromulina nebulosa, Strain UTEXLB2642" /NCGR_SAMPLE_ID=MMETSP1095 /ASSEMBLY_ACC=CAM_ASM_000446 /LENGTH=463 /DNA_ID=CAMNT_0042137181 /DNA_START=1212 /DNA_END=2600 /DNA_ORIENTATION=-
MRIAGRVTGTGRFQRDKADESLQQYVDELAAATLLSNQPASVRSITDEFPSLSTSTSNNSLKQTENKHPKSMVSTLQTIEANKRKYEVERENLLKKLEDRRIKRNEQLASALGLPTIQSLLLYINRSDFEVIESFDKKYSEILQHPLYPNVMIQWAKDNSRDLAVIEKKLFDMIISDTEVSVHLKPMSQASRSVMTGLAKFYGLNCYEHDREPKRYVSFVKRLDSCIPNVYLSDAAKKGTSNIPLAQMMESITVSIRDYSNYESVLYFSATEAPLNAFNSQTSTFGVGGQLGLSLNVAEVFRILSYDILKYGNIALVNTSPNDLGINDLKLAGGSTVGVYFQSYKLVCNAYFALMNPLSSYLTKGYKDIYSIHCLLPLVQPVDSSRLGRSDCDNWRGRSSDKSVDRTTDRATVNESVEHYDLTANSEINDAWDDDESSSIQLPNQLAISLNNYSISSQLAEDW